MMNTWKNFWMYILFLLLPRGCAGCDYPDEILCGDCSVLFKRFHSQKLYSRAPTSARVFSCTLYEGYARHAILAWKDHDDEELTSFLCEFLCDTLHNYFHRTSIPALESFESNQHICVIPVPSSPSSIRKRGRWQVLPLARAIAQELNNMGYSASMIPALKVKSAFLIFVDRILLFKLSQPDSNQGRAVWHKFTRRKSVQLSGRQRVNRLQGRLRYSRKIPDNSLIILVDDIMTTGSTLRACDRFLKEKVSKRICAAFTLAYVENPELLD